MVTPLTHGASRQLTTPGQSTTTNSAGTEPAGTRGDSMLIADIPDRAVWVESQARELMDPRPKSVTGGDCTRVVQEDYQIEDDVDGLLATEIYDWVQGSTVTIDPPA